MSTTASAVRAHGDHRKGFMVVGPPSPEGQKCPGQYLGSLADGTRTPGTGLPLARHPVFLVGYLLAADRASTADWPIR